MNETEDDLIRQVVKLTGLNTEQAQMKIQEARANAAFNRPPPQGSMVSGRYISPGATGYAAAGINKYNAGQQMKNLQGRMPQAAQGVDNARIQAIMMEQSLRNKTPAAQQLQAAGDVAQPAPAMSEPQPEGAPGMFNPNAKIQEKAKIDAVIARLMGG